MNDRNSPSIDISTMNEQNSPANMDFYMWHIRGSQPEDNIDPDDAYVNLPSLFSIRLFHGGVFENYPGREYVNGKVTYIDQYDVNDFGKDVLEEMVKGVGYSVDAVIYCHFKVPHSHLDIGLRFLEYEADFERLFVHVRRGVKLIDIYLELWTSRVLMDNHLDMLQDIAKDHERQETVSDINTVVEAEFVQAQRLNEQSDEPGSERAGCNDYSKDDEEYGSDDESGSDDSDDSDDSDYVVDNTVVEDVEVDYAQYKVAIDFDCSEEIQEDEEVNEDEAMLEDEDLEDFESNSDNDDMGLPLSEVMKKRRRMAKNSAHSPFFVGQYIDNKEQLRNLVKTLSIETRR